MKKNILSLFTLSICILLSFASCTKSSNQRWTQEEAKEWSAAQPWLSGCNFQPSSAINQIEMWQFSSFDSARIDLELGWAEELGFNTMRVYLSSVVWQNEPEAFKNNMDKFLTISAKHKIRPLFVFFDDCWKPESAFGKQDDPEPGVHNSGWVQDPSVSLRADTATLYPILEKYVKDILSTFKDDKRILLWDMYNEPGNGGHGINSLPLLRNAFKWGREINPIQPLSAGIWYFGCNELNVFQIENSDIITYHNYRDRNNHQEEINFYKMFDRPLICTEYMARRNDSKFENIMPMLKENNIGAINWGFVSGKTNTIFAWAEPKPNEKEPELWFHDILRQDHTAFDDNEVELIKKLNGKSSTLKEISRDAFKAKIDGKNVDLYTLKNKSGALAQITNFGGRVVSLWMPDRNGKFDDVVTGQKTIEDYQSCKEFYFGALIGRYGNRIAKGQFTLDGKKYQLAINNGENTLHGGVKGYHNVVWDARFFKNDKDEDNLELKYLSPDGEEGYPGNLNITVVYTLTDSNELKIQYRATTDKLTVLNLTHHSFFNLHGFSDGEAQSINTHIMQINGSKYTPTDEGLIPTGKIESVKGTPMDFTNPTAIGDRVNEDFIALKYGKGYDHNWILDKKENELTEAAVVYEPSNGRVMQVITTEPALQFYGGNFFDGSVTGKYGEKYGLRSSIVLETQHYPDSPNHPNFPTTELKPGEEYTQTCIYKFSVK